ncbi:MAG: glutamine-hydrolyzing GMP synthase [Lachnospiraceae bacterium]|nr:glutamine-hydrolyzing GMP synthase [Lachnospiraceae bacterium]
MEREKIVVIDFGGQYNQLVARRVRECNVYCEIYSYRTPLDKIMESKPKGIILTGGPNSVYEDGAPGAGRELFETGVPVLGLCYGAQLMQHVLGGEVKKADNREYGRTRTLINTKSRLFENVGEAMDPRESFADLPSNREKSNKAFSEIDTMVTQVWMSHFDYISRLAPGFSTVAYTENCPVAAAENEEKKLYAIQFHPEVLHTVEGTKILYNFVRKICDCSGSWRMDTFVENAVINIRERVGRGKVLLALSGGVDSSVLAALLARAIGQQLTCVFVDHGLLRKNEGDDVEAIFGSAGNFDINFVRVNAQERYYEKLNGVSEPEQKRKIIGEEFIRVFEEEAKKIGKVDYLAQGTIYPDVVESGLGGESAVIKSHHNVGGLPDHVDFKGIIEPLRDLFKDEVRKVGLKLGLPNSLVYRQPFPGPGLGVRIVGEVTADKVRMVQDADAIYREEIATAVMEWQMKKAERENDRANYEGIREVRKVGLTGEPPWMPDQYFAALTNMRSVGVMGDERTYDYAIALRAVKTVDFMTAEAADIPFNVLQTVMSRIINEVRGVNRVFYDLTSKPPGTIELE